MRMTDDYLEQMRAHVDEGGTLSQHNGIALLTELELTRKQSKILMTLCGSLVEICTPARGGRRTGGVVNRPDIECPSGPPFEQMEKNMPYTNDEIMAKFAIIKDRVALVAGADLGDPERKVVAELADAALCILESVILDINNIAFYMRERHERRDRDI